MGWRLHFRAAGRLRSNLSLIPLLFAVAAFGLARLMALVDTTLHVPASLTFSEATATSLLAATAGAMISLLGIIFAFFMLLTQSATLQLSPRALGLLYHNLSLKLTLGVVVATVTYAFLLLARIRPDYTPSASVIMAGVLVLTSLLTFLTFLNRVSKSIRPAAVADRVLGEGLSAVRELYPPFGGRAAPALDASPTPPGQVVRHGGRGSALQGFDRRGLVADAARAGAVIVLSVAVGDYLPPGAPIGMVYPAGAVLRSSRLQRRWATGVERAFPQDPMFALRLLVDIASRALSPGINDPTTAVQMLDRIEVLLREVGFREVGPAVLRDASGQVRVLLPGPRWGDFVRLATTEILLYGGGSPQITRRLRALLEGLAGDVPPLRRPPLSDVLARLEQTVQERLGEALPLAGVGDRQGFGPSRAPAELPLLH